MFFSKKKVKSAAENLAAEAAQAVAVLEHEFERISRIADAGERYIALDDFETAVTAMQDETEAKVVAVTYKSAKKSDKIITASSVVGVAAVIGVALFVNPFIMLGGFAVAAGEYGGSKYFGGKLMKRDTAIVKQAMAGYRASVGALIVKIFASKEDIVRNGLCELAGSPHFNDVCDRFPKLAATFAKRAVGENRFDAARSEKLQKPSMKPSNGK